MACGGISECDAVRCGVVLSSRKWDSAVAYPRYGRYGTYPGRHVKAVPLRSFYLSKTSHPQIDLWMIPLPLFKKPSFPVVYE